MENKNERKLMVFLDAVGRTIVGEKIGETETVVEVKNPAVANIVPQEVIDPATGGKLTRISLQLLPVFFKEFLLEKDNGVVFNYLKTAITTVKSDTMLDVRLYEQYNSTFISVPQQQVMQPILQPMANMKTPDGNQELPKLELFNPEK